MIRVLFVDDHPAVRAGLVGVARSEPGLVPVGAVGSGDELWPALRHTRPDVVLLDYDVPGDNGLLLCHRLKGAPPAPAVVLYTAYAGERLLLPASLAGADAMLAKSAAPVELFTTIREVGRGAQLLPGVPPEVLHAAASAIPEDELPLLGMLLDGTAPRDIAETLGVGVDAVGRRTRGLITRLTRSARPRLV